MLKQRNEMINPIQQKISSWKLRLMFLKVVPDSSIAISSNNKNEINTNCLTALETMNGLLIL
jgi:hypothetical protein